MGWRQVTILQSGLLGFCFESRDMPAQPKILLLDDDQDFLDLYREMLSQHLPSMPEVRTANTGARALSLLESEPFTLLVVDLNLSKMDGLQVLTIARRKYPQLRLVVLTGIRDEQFRTRAYALGVDQYWIKPETDQEMGLFMESIESLISREAQAGFRGVQSKSLVDIIQLECLSQSSCMLKITNGVTEGKIYIQNGEVIDAEFPGMTAEPAFQRILSWKTGSFETLPPDPTRVRTIFTSYQGLLLNTAQAIDEAASQEHPAAPSGSVAGATTPAPADGLAPLLAEVSQMEGVEFVLALGTEKSASKNFWGLENPKPVAEFTRQALENFRSLGERLQVGELQHILGTGPQRKVAVGPCGKSELCIGFPPALSVEQVRDSFKNILTKWAS
jgi:CheY-like chemotaxis protein